MPNEANHTIPHELKLENRARLCVSGVQEVESFDESAIVLHTSMGVLLVRGEGLHLQTLSIDGGQVAVNGTVSALSYAEAPRPGGFFRRLLR